ncbi:hypothetical protein HU200_005968 [Digitaria exilis]|uniref:Retrotransposon gag domain-containing protein n=1 Tax=Digitaria exilis TaxID=1010633 RepID=A0A835FSA3_9POAL|nr:hypothetical protein HU200_005968 [Digitaria exilis]
MSIRYRLFPVFRNPAAYGLLRRSPKQSLARLRFLPPLSLRPQEPWIVDVNRIGTLSSTEPPTSRTRAKRRRTGSRTLAAAPLVAWSDAGRAATVAAVPSPCRAPQAELRQPPTARPGCRKPCSHALASELTVSDEPRERGELTTQRGRPPGEAQRRGGPRMAHHAGAAEWGISVSFEGSPCPRTRVSVPFEGTLHPRMKFHPRAGHNDSTPSAINAGHDRTLRFTMTRMGHRSPPTEPGTVPLSQALPYHDVNHSMTDMPPHPPSIDTPRSNGWLTRKLEGAIPARTVHGMGSTVHLATSTPSPALLVFPYYEQHGTRCYAPLLDVRPHGRNQDKTPVHRQLACQVGDKCVARLCAWIPMAGFSRRRFPMGSNDSLPAGYEIRFESLRFQATGNGYLMHILPEGSDGRQAPPPTAAPRRRRRPGPRTRRARAARRVANANRAPSAREGDVSQFSIPAIEASSSLQMSVERFAPTQRFHYELDNAAAVHSSLARMGLGSQNRQPGYRWVPRRSNVAPDNSYSGSEGENVPNRSRHCLTCSDDSDDDYDPTRECFVINDDVSDGHTTGEEDNEDGTEDPVGAQPSDEQKQSLSEGEPHPRRQPRATHPHLGDGNASPPPNSNHGPAGQGGGRDMDARRAGRNDDLAPRTSQKLIAAAALLRAMPEPATPEGRKLHLEAQKLVEDAARQQDETSRGEHRGESSVRSPPPDDDMQARSQGNSHRDAARHHTDEPRTPEAEPLPARDARGTLDDGDARNVLNRMRLREEAWTHLPRRNGRNDDQDGLPEPTGTRVFSRIIRAAPIPSRFRQPTTITKYSGETDPRVWLNDYRLACQLGGATDDAMIIRNLSLHLADSARTWIEHLPPDGIHDWNDLVETFLGNFQGTVAPGSEMMDRQALHTDLRAIASQALHTHLQRARLFSGSRIRTFFTTSSSIVARFVAASVSREDAAAARVLLLLLLVVLFFFLRPSSMAAANAICYDAEAAWYSARVLPFSSSTPPHSSPDPAPPHQTLAERSKEGMVRARRLRPLRRRLLPRLCVFSLRANVLRRGACDLIVAGEGAGTRRTRSASAAAAAASTSRRAPAPLAATPPPASASVRSAIRLYFPSLLLRFPRC